MAKRTKVIVEVKGAKEVRRRLSRLGKSGAKRAARPALSKQQDRFEKSSKQRVAIDEGKLKSNIRDYPIRLQRNSILAQVGVNGPQAAVEEFGTKAGTEASKAVGVRAPRSFIFMHLDNKEIDRISERVINQVADDIVRKF